MKPLHKALFFMVPHHIPFTGMRLALPLYALHLGATPAVVGMMMALFSLLPMLGSVHMGRLMDRKGMRLPMLAGSVVLVLSVLLAAFSSRYEPLFLVSLVMGGGYYTMHNAIQQLAGRYSTPADRISNYSTISVCFAVTLALVPMATGFMIDHIGFTATFLILCVLPLPSLAMLLMDRLPGLQPTHRAPAAPVEEKKGSMLDLVQDPGLRQLYLFNILFTVAWDLFLVMTPLYGVELGLSPSQIGIVVGAFSVAMFVVRMIARMISRHFTPRQTLHMCITVSGLGALGFGLVDGVPALVLFSFVMGMGQGMAAPVINTLLYDTSPPGRVAEAMGLRTAIAKGCQVVLPVMGGSLTSLLGVAPVYWIIAGMQLIAAWTARGNWRK